MSSTEDAVSPPRWLLSLPDDILLIVLCNLPLVAKLRCTAVCTQLYALLGSTELRLESSRQFVLPNGEVLRPSEGISSRSGRHWLTFQDDSNVVIYDRQQRTSEGPSAGLPTWALQEVDGFFDIGYQAHALSLGRDGVLRTFGEPTEDGYCEFSSIGSATGS